MIKIAICDDDRSLCDDIKGLLIDRYGAEVNVVTYTQADQLKNDYVKGKEYNIADILFMDINLNGVNGIDLAAEIQAHFGKVKIIFITGHMEYCTEIFRANPNNFMVKPVKAETLYAAVERARGQILEEERDCFVVTCKGSVFKIRARDILYFESEKRKVILHGRNDDWTIYRKLDDVQQELPDYFLRCHQSYLVNMNEIKSLRPLKLELYCGIEVPISRPKYHETKECFLKYLGCDGTLDE